MILVNSLYASPQAPNPYPRFGCILIFTRVQDVGSDPPKPPCSQWSNGMGARMLFPCFFRLAHGFSQYPNPRGTN